MPRKLKSNGESTFKCTAYVFFSLQFPSIAQLLLVEFCTAMYSKGKVATDTNILYLRTRYRYMKGVSSVSFRYLDTDTINKSWLKMYLRYRYRSKLGWIFWFGPIHVTIRRNLACYERKKVTNILHRAPHIPEPGPLVPYLCFR